MGLLVDELHANSMLTKATILSKKYARNLWENYYSEPQYHKIVQEASVWLDTYPEAQLLGENKRNVLDTLCDERLFEILADIGFKVIHTNPMREAGGVRPDGSRYPSTDGGYDRIDYSISHMYGEDHQYQALSKMALAHGIYIAGDVVPGHTGKGFDFRLAELNFQDYPNIYAMTVIPQEDWHLLPEVTNGDSQNLSKEQEKILVEKGYLPAVLQEVIFYKKGVKETNWSATREVLGVDGITRRWVYLHFFKDSQPSLNWLDGGFAAHRVIAADLLQARFELGDKLVRLDATFDLAIEKSGTLEPVQSRGHILGSSITAQLAMLMRSYGGWSYEENCTSLGSLKESTYSADLFYDFATRTGIFHALITGDARLLNLQQQLLIDYEVDPGRLIHAMQNHDNIVYEMIHFIDNADEKFRYGCRDKLSGSEINEQVLREARDFCKEHSLVFSYSFGGILANLVSVCAARLNIKDVKNCTVKDKDRIITLMCLLAFYNAMQPGILQISAWDLLGAVTLDESEIKEFSKDGDLRWLARGGYDLLGKSEKEHSEFGVPRAYSLFGSLEEQLKDENSFVQRVKKIIQLRDELKIATAELVSVLTFADDSLYGVKYQVTENKKIYIVLINFSNESKVLGITEDIGSEITLAPFEHIVTEK